LKRGFTRFFGFALDHAGWARGSTCSGRATGIAADGHVKPMSMGPDFEDEQGGRDVSWIASASKVAVDSPGD
jgi:hypothetical protein